MDNLSFEVREMTNFTLFYTPEQNPFKFLTPRRRLW